jgi:hypothetical protein
MSGVGSRPRLAERQPWAQSRRRTAQLNDRFLDRLGAGWEKIQSLSLNDSGTAAFVKSFGRREAYESLRGTNPRATDGGLWVFLFSAERGEVATDSGT